jgi:predicted MFS family arabinose efflux permease
VVASGWFPTLGGQIFWILILSFGFHYFEATNQSLTLQYFNVIEAPIIISRLRSVTAVGSLFMGLIIVCLATHLDYRVLFALAGSLAIIAAFWSFGHRPVSEGLPVQKKGLVFKKKYWLFYVLTGLSGARRQIFDVFSVFLLVERFNFSLFQMSLLMLFNNIINWFLNPFIGRAINAIGEKTLLRFKYITVLMLCIGYVFCNSSILAASLYIIDQILFCFTVSIRTFFQKISDPSDIAPSMAVGVTVNHIAAVSVPFVGGYLWMLNYRIPFYMGAFFALTSLVMTNYIKTKK